MTELDRGVGLALDRILKVPQVEQIEGIPEPEQLEERPVVRSPIKMPQQRPMAIESPVDLGGEPQQLTRSPIRMPLSRQMPMPAQGVEEQVESETGEKINIKIMPDGSITRTDLDIPFLPEGTPVKVGSANMETGEFVPMSEDELWEGLMATVPEDKQLQAKFYKVMSDNPWMAEVIEKGSEGAEVLGQIFTGMGLPLREFEKSVVGTPEEKAFRKQERAKIDEQLKKALSEANTREERSQAHKEAYRQWKEFESKLVGEYKEEPMWKQLLYESPAFLATGGLTATALSKALTKVAAKGGLKGGLAVAGKVPLAPIVGVEKVAEATLKGAGKLVALPVKGLGKGFMAWGKAGRGEVVKLGEDLVKTGTNPKLIKRVDRLLQRAAEGERLELPIQRLEKELGPALGKRLRLSVREVKLKSEKQLKDRFVADLEKAEVTWSEISSLRKPHLKGVAEAYAEALEKGLGKGYAAWEKAAESRVGKWPDKLVEALEKSYKPKEVKRLFDMIIESESVGPLTKGPLGDALRNWLVLGRTPRPYEIEGLNKIFGVQFGEKLTSTAAKVMDVLNVPRALLASFDQSAVLRQNLLLSFGHPLKASKAFVDMFKASFSPKNFRLIDAGIKSNKYWDVLVRSGFDYLEVGSTGLARKAEPYMTTLAQRIPYIGGIVRWSERGFVTYSNKIRSDIFYGYANQYAHKRGGKQILSGVANILNVLGGRGTMKGQLEKAAPFMSNILFSPRLQVARLQLPFKLILPRSMGGVGDVARKEAIRDIVAFLAPTLSMLKLMDATGAANVNWDRNSTDFLKIQIGNVRIDPWGGFQQWIKLLIRISTGLRRTQTGALIKINRGDETLTFLRTKLSPAVGLATDMLYGETMIGEEVFDLEKLPEQIKSRLAPMFVQDVIDAMQQEGMMGTALASPGFFGVGIQAYAPRGLEEWQESVGETIDTADMREDLSDDYNEAVERWYDFQQLPRGKVRDNYLEENPEVEADLYFWGEISSIENPDAWKIVQKRLKEYGLPEDILPIRKVEETWEAGDKTPTEIWGNLLDMTPTYISNYIQANEGEWKEKDLATLIPKIEELKTADRSLLDKYNRAVINEDSDFRAAFRRTNPEIDAALLFWKGQKTYHSTRALTLLRQKADALGIPHSTIPALQRKVAPSGTIKTRRL